MQRQLNLYGFKCVNRGEDKGAFYHPSFRHGDWETVKRITRYVPVKKNMTVPDPTLLSRQVEIAAENAKDMQLLTNRSITPAELSMPMPSFDKWYGNGLPNFSEEQQQVHTTYNSMYVPPMQSSTGNFSTQTSCSNTSDQQQMWSWPPAQAKEQSQLYSNASKVTEEKWEKQSSESDKSELSRVSSLSNNSGETTGISMLSSRLGFRVEPNYMKVLREENCLPKEKEIIKEEKDSNVFAAIRINPDADLMDDLQFLDSEFNLFDNATSFLAGDDMSLSNTPRVYQEVKDSAVIAKIFCDASTNTDLTDAIHGDGLTALCDHVYSV